jgi:hypothetical protein
MIQSIKEFDAIRDRVITDAPMGEMGDGEEIFLLSMFQSLETIETLAARLPSKVQVVRSMTAMQKMVRPRVPKTLRMWKKINRVLEAPTPAIKVNKPAPQVVVPLTDWRKSRSNQDIILDLHAQLMAAG